MFKIGFSAEVTRDTPSEETHFQETHTITPRKSVVNIHFPARNMTLPYYNDRFDLQCGDLVYVDGKLEGLRGRVVDVSYNFKIKLSDYKRVIAVADTKVSGTFHLAGSHFLTFDRNALPFAKAVTWFCAPENEDDEYVSGYDGKAFSLNDLHEMGFNSSVAERGADYYHDNNVVYICVENSSIGHAIVEGSKPYLIEFHYENGLISDLTCSCFCTGPCKHQFAALLQLKRDPGLLKKIDAEIEKEQQEGAKPGRELTEREKLVKAKLEQRIKKYILTSLQKLAEIYTHTRFTLTTRSTLIPSKQKAGASCSCFYHSVIRQH